MKKTKNTLNQNIKAKKLLNGNNKNIKYSKSTEFVPSWVVGRDVSLDAYYTTPDIAKYCYESLKKTILKKNQNINKYTFIEPSAGTGSFYKLLPKKRRIGIDVDKYDKEYIRKEFLSWYPQENKKYVAIGNPPFGYRGWLALSFINSASRYCDYVGFILPKGFTSESRGSPKYRVPMMKLIHSEELPHSIFQESNGNSFQVNTVWQIWEKIKSKENTKSPTSKSFGKKQVDLNGSEKKTHGGWLTYKRDEYLDLHTVDLRKERLCGTKYMNDYDFFLQRSFFKKPPKTVKKFSDVNYVSGYGFIVKKEKRKILKILNSTDWTKHCTLTVHNVSHISMYHIRNALAEGGLKSSKPQKNLKEWMK